MRLSELRTGERGVIVKVIGHGGFRKRIVEMGFIKGKKVEVLLNAPLKDPVKYKVMGYEVSLRRDEAQMIEVRPYTPTPKSAKTEGVSASPAPSLHCLTCSCPCEMSPPAPPRGETINIALVGNPNCGKTSLFNVASGAHERVGNYSGVTVDAKEGHATFGGYTMSITDLPGTYSLSAYSPEELYVRRQLIDYTPDVIINVIDSSNLERNLYLTSQLVDMHIKVVVALNMFDEFERRGDSLDCDVLGRLFGVTIVPTVFRSGRGVDDLLRAVIALYEDDNPAHVHLNHGPVLEDSISALQDSLKQSAELRRRYSTRYLAIKLLEGDGESERAVTADAVGSSVITLRDRERQRIEREVGEDAETAVMDAKYGFIHGALREAHYKSGKKANIYQVTHAVDSFVTHHFFGFPLFLLLIYAMFEVTFTVGQYPMDWIEAGVAWLSEMISTTLPEGTFRDLLLDGVIGGVGAVIVFLPQILILYAFISFMEDTGYMARAAFIMDKLMHKMGLHGKSFIPMIMGFGCNVPAIMATRTIESRRSRLLTMLILPMMSCSARLPVYIMITATFFAVEYQSSIMIALYAIGIILSVVMCRLFAAFVVKGEDTPFVMELPPYRIPTAKAILRHTWEKGKQYLRKMGGIILIASIVVWALGYFPHDDSLEVREQQERSYIGMIGKAVEPVFAPQGFSWKLDVGLIAGVGAKEIVASTLGVLYSDAGEEFDEENARYDELREKMSADGVTPLSAFCYLLFVLIYFPCLATIAAIRHESGSWRYALFAALYTTALAWVVSAAVYQIGSLL